MLRCKWSLQKLERNKYFTPSVVSAIKTPEGSAVVGPCTTLGMFHLEVNEKLDDLFGC